MDKIPIYRFKVDANDDSQLEAVAMVDSPAIEMNWQAFSNQIKFAADAEKRIISGPLMVAELPIYRRDAEHGEYYGIFTADDIYNLRNKFFKNNKSKEVNMMHDSTMMVEGVYMVESFLIDSKRGINSPEGFNLSDGSWFGSYKVDNEQVWNDYIKSGEFKGFSVEGLFNIVKIDAKPLSVIEQIIEVVKQIEN
ncbi:MAG: XkdF-like putative serine protease domain-containing protein [Chitinophagia bacterium]